MVNNGNKLADYVERLENTPRVSELATLVAEIESGVETLAEGAFRALGMLVTDGVLDHDQHAVNAAIQQLRRLYAQKSTQAKSLEMAETAGRVLGIIDVLQSAKVRTIPLGVLVEVERESHAHHFLDVLSNQPAWSNKSLAKSLEIDETEVSRVGKRLVERGLARKRRIGRENYWEITPRGGHALELVARTT
jgi:predicted transcriptional regulator